MELRSMRENVVLKICYVWVAAIAVLLFEHTSRGEVSEASKEWVQLNACVQG
jgi:hypothetical protein